MDREKIARELLKLAKELIAMGAHHHREGKDWYVDSDFVNLVQRVYPSSRLEHMGFGEFYLDTPDGKLEFVRVSGKYFPGQSGRSHLLEDDAGGAVIKKAIKLMERARKSEKV